jgi:hypothetical protein
MGGMGEGEDLEYLRDIGSNGVGFFFETYLPINAPKLSIVPQQTLWKKYNISIDWPP